MSLDNELERMAAALDFLTRLESDEVLINRCETTDLDGRMAIAMELGLEFTEPEFRTTIKNWDYLNLWNRWLSPGRIASKLDDVPIMDDSYSLSDQLVEEFSRDGHIVLPKVASASEIDIYRPIIRGCIADFNTENKALSERAFGAFLLVTNLRLRNEAAARFVQAQRFGKIAAELLGVEAVRVYLDETFYKEPGGSITAWHQDRLYFPLDTNNVVTMWMPVVDITAEMGTLMFASRSHQSGDLGYQPISDEAETYFQDFIKEHGYSLSRADAMKAGDAVFHHGWVLHGASANTSDRPREVMSVVYYEDGTRLPEPNNIYQERALKYGFRGKQPGDLAESSAHPVAYKRNPAS
jgi:hypothetical protein